jgi:hypothetical protein
MARHILSLLLVIAAPLANARADTTYATLAGNLTSSAQTSGSVQFLPISGTVFAQRFTTGTLPAIGDGDGSGQVLYEFSWNLLPAQGGFDPTDEDNPFPDLETTYQLNLLSDAGGSPGSSLLFSPISGTLSAPGVLNFTYADLAFAPTIFLQSDTSYWMSVSFQFASDTIGQPLLLPFTTDSIQTVPGTIDDLMVNTGSGWSGVSEQCVVQIQAEVVPEPTTFALVAMGAALIGWRCMRRKKIV